MGNLCISYFYEPEKKYRCKKCNDKFKIHFGGKSQRNSCRHHNYIIKNNSWYCNICNKFKHEIMSRNCYHTIHLYPNS